MGITNRGKYGLQIGAGREITNRGRMYYKLGQVKRLQIGAKGLQNAAEITNRGKRITNRGRDYKTGQGLQIGAAHYNRQLKFHFHGKKIGKKNAIFKNQCVVEGLINSIFN